MLLLLFYLKKIRRQLPSARKASTHNQSFFTRREVLSRYFSIKMWLSIDLCRHCRPERGLTDGLQSIALTRIHMRPLPKNKEASFRTFFPLLSNAKYAGTSSYSSSVKNKQEEKQRTKYYHTPVRSPRVCRQS